MHEGGEMKPKIGFIGLGEMGKWMAINVAKAGFPLTVYDIRPEPVKGSCGKWCSSAENPADVAKKSDCILLSLPDTQDGGGGHLWGKRDSRRTIPWGNCRLTSAPSIIWLL